MQAVVNEHSVETEQEAKSLPIWLLSSERVAGQRGGGWEGIVCSFQWILAKPQKGN